MTTYAALLRGINLGSHAKIKMPALRQLFEALGHADVQTYLQSGNVVFTADDADPDKLARAIERRIKHDLDLTVPVLLRSQAELADIVANNPFLKQKADPATLHVTFLAEEPDRERIDAIDSAFGEPDGFAIVGRELYLHCPGGYGRTKLNNNFFERRLKVGATTRNWKTVTRLRELTGG
jgi:uncharacterized protein (DUF1697 family)